jgi:hypothetical protein
MARALITSKDFDPLYNKQKYKILLGLLCMSNKKKLRARISNEKKMRLVYNITWRNMGKKLMTQKWIAQQFDL